MTGTWYKATRLDGTSFYDSSTVWRVGRITRHPKPDLSLGLCSKGVLHASDAPGEALLGGSWPCRLFVVEPRGKLVSDGSHKHGCAAWKVVEEIEAWQALGPNGRLVVALIERAKRLTPEEAKQLAAARGAAWSAAGAAWDAAWSAARRAAWSASGAAWDAAWDASDAALATVTRDLISEEHYRTLAGPWESVMGPIDALEAGK